MEEERFDRLENKVDGLSDTVSVMGKKVDDLSDTVTVLSGTVDKLGERVDKLAEKVDQTSDTVTALSGTVSELTVNMNDLIKITAHMAANMATKDDIANMATKDDLAKMETRLVTKPYLDKKLADQATEIGDRINRATGKQKDFNTELVDGIEAHNLFEAERVEKMKSLAV